MGDFGGGGGLGNIDFSKLGGMDPSALGGAAGLGGEGAGLGGEGAEAEEGEDDVR